MCKVLKIWQEKKKISEERKKLVQEFINSNDFKTEGEIKLDVPRDRQRNFDPIIVENKNVCKRYVESKYV